MHIAIKIGLYAIGSIAFLGVAQQFMQKEETKTSPGATDRDIPVVGTEKAVLNTKVSQIDLDAKQMKGLVTAVTKDVPVGTVVIGTANKQQIMM